MLRKFVKILFTFLNKILYRIEYVNLDKLPTEGPAILVANHQHAFDISAIHCISKPWVYWVAKKELVDIPIIGRLIAKMGVLPVDRKKNDLSVAKSIYTKIKEKEIIGIFPQGTRIKSKEHISRIVPKTGAIHFAIKTNTPLIPIGISGTFKLFSKIKVIIGDPINFDLVPENTQGSTDIMKKTIYMMTLIYGLVGERYYLDEEILMQKEIK